MATGIQGLVNKVKSTAREFADSMTPVLKASFWRKSKCYKHNDMQGTGTGGVYEPGLPIFYNHTFS